MANSLLASCQGQRQLRGEVDVAVAHRQQVLGRRVVGALDDREGDLVEAQRHVGRDAVELLAGLELEIAEADLDRRAGRAAALAVLRHAHLHAAHLDRAELRDEATEVERP